ncbi:unnamed protein product [marine sediment metagenome]|uniref:Uncharacterized protein n=1 Tax=marine sediment metagenome TaxID=412755 RepID=X1VZW7_9ZZZZ
MLLKDYTFLARGDYRKPKGYFVEGKAAGNKGQWTHFITLSNVLGEESESENIISIDQGWLELSTGRTHSMVEAVAPTPPYVKGWWDGKGYFHPKPARVYGLKLKLF